MMIRSLWTGATGMQAQQQNIDSIANDLTNVNTYGYKKRHLNFEDLYYQTLRAAGIQGTNGGNNVPVGIQIGNGVKLAATTPVFTPGNPQQTDLWSDLRIDDSVSFFGVTLSDGTTAYTRDGSFRVDDTGELRTVNGQSLSPPVAGIPNPAPDITVTASGVVQYIDPAGGGTQTVGQINTYTFINPGGLNAIGANQWLATDASGAAIQGTPDTTAGSGAIQSGWLETSNVDAITEMVNMISAQRAYEFNSRTIQTSDEMLQTVNSLKR